MAPRSGALGLLKYVLNEVRARLGVMMPESLETEVLSVCGGLIR